MHRDPQLCRHLIRPVRWLVLAVAVLLPIADAAAADLPKAEEVVAPSVFVSLSGVHPGGGGRLAVVGEILEGWHVNAHHPSEDYLIPTAVTLAPIDGITLGEPVYPEGEMVTFEFAGTALRVYEGRVTIGVPFSVDAGAVAGPRIVSGTLSFQPCNDRICLAPARVAFEAEIRVAEAGEAVTRLNVELFETMGGAAPPAAAGMQGEMTEGIGGASFLVFGLIFLGGLALNLTPCVFPLIPITVAFFGGQVNRSAVATFGLSSVYVLGMATTYSLLGVAAAMTGGLFGAALQHPWVLAFVAAVLLLLSLSMFGVYEFRIPGSSRLGSRRGVPGAYFMGLVVGIIAAPCIGPFVVGLLATVAREADVWLGFWKFFTLSLGLGTPYLFLGAFSGGLSLLPRAGEWMEAIKHLFGLVLVAMAAYFLGQAVPPPVGPALLPAVLVISAVWLLFFERAGRWAGLAVLRPVLAAGSVAFAAWLAWPVGDGGKVPFAPYSEEAVAEAARLGRPVMIDFTADWCIPCREYDSRVFTDPRVIAQSTGFVNLKADLTRTGSPEVMDLVQEFGIFGPPTIVFIAADGSERTDLRLVGYVGPDRFLDRMRAAAGEAGANSSDPEAEALPATGPAPAL